MPRHVDTLGRLRFPKGKAFLVVWLKVFNSKAKRGDISAGRIQIQPAEMCLRDAKGNALLPFGNCTRDGRLQQGATTFSFFDVGDDGVTTYDLVYIVPDTERQFTLEFGPAKQKLKVDATVEEKLDVTRPMAARKAYPLNSSFRSPNEPRSSVCFI